MSRDQKLAMHEYLDALLFDEKTPASQPESAPVAEKNTAELERLLAQATLREHEQAEAQAETETQARVQAEQAAVAKKQAEQQRLLELERQQEAEMAAQLEKQAEQAQGEALIDVPPPPVSNMENYKQGDFQALFFSVAGLKLAVPLKSLGGIHQWKEANTIFGKPDWYLGIMTNRDEKLNVVDTARWVMPEKYTPELAESINYQYLIMLGESQWGLACETLVTTESLSPEDVQWRKGEGSKRPWLAGVVREKMCAILDVDAMVDMLEKGLNSQD
ncbi:chemotaxis protein CheW [Aliidiomarina sedimenti]|nr:chemotaxis protein CheW [Aliidiomarina sedimenti]